MTGTNRGTALLTKDVARPTELQGCRRQPQRLPSETRAAKRDVAFPNQKESKSPRSSRKLAFEDVGSLVPTKSVRKLTRGPTGGPKKRWARLR